MYQKWYLLFGSVGNCALNKEQWISCFDFACTLMYNHSPSSIWDVWCDRNWFLWTQSCSKLGRDPSAPSQSTLNLHWFGHTDRECCLKSQFLLRSQNIHHFKVSSQQLNSTQPKTKIHTPHSETSPQNGPTLVRFNRYSTTGAEHKIWEKAKESSHPPPSPIWFSWNPIWDRNLDEFSSLPPKSTTDRKERELQNFLNREWLFLS